MQVMALTGGIASGKSTVCRLLGECLPSMVIFDCDAAVHRMLEGDPEVAAILAEFFGAEALDGQGRIDRHFLRGRVFAEPAARLRLEEILHPRVRQECLDSLQRAATRGADLFIADVPLFFEKGFDFGQSQVLVVASSRATQIQRLKARGGFDDLLIESILVAQLPVQEKIALADVVFWNEGPQAVLRSQLRRFAQEFLMTLTPLAESSDLPADPATPAAVAPVPVSIDINQFRLKPLAELQALAEASRARIQGGIPKSQLVYELLCFYGHAGSGLVCEGVLEQSVARQSVFRAA